MSSSAHATHRHQARERLRAFATDFDGTLAHDGTVPKAALAGLERLKKAGFVLLLVTGREIEELSQIFTRLDLFDMVVAENGGLLYSPANKVSQPLAEPPPPSLIERLMAKGVKPIAVGHVIVATWEPHQHAVLEAIKELGLELHVIFNKGAVMILPSGVSKASGLEAALQQFKVKPAEVVAVGDAENDHAMLAACRFPVAVANALPALREHARHVTRKARGDGVAELIDMILSPGFVVP
jgi:hydroxymethylpyrimidine pyrophosphatase-like HAD family hydrolase